VSDEEQEPGTVEPTPAPQGEPQEGQPLEAPDDVEPGPESDPRPEPTTE
jgi:hypothetical protein